MEHTWNTNNTYSLAEDSLSEYSLSDPGPEPPKSLVVPVERVCERESMCVTERECVCA